MTSEKKEQIRLRLLLLSSTNGGRLTPDAVIEDARNPDSPLHDQFEWDMAKAAYRHWVEQARNLITSVKIVETIEEEQVTTVFYVRDPRVEHDKQGYVSLPTLKSDKDLAREAIHAEFLRARAVMQRAKTLAAILDLEDPVDEADRKITQLVDITRPETA